MSNDDDAQAGHVRGACNCPDESDFELPDDICDDDTQAAQRVREEW